MRKNYFLGFVFVLASLGLHAQVWEPVGDATGVSAGAAGRLSLFTDYQDNLFIAYYDVTVTNASAQKFDGSSWSYLGDGPGFTTETGIYNTFAVDYQGTAFFTNQKAWPEAGMEARKFQDGAWTLLPEVTSTNVNFQASAVSADNTLFVVSGDNGGTVRKLSPDHEYWDQVGDTGFFQGVPYFLDMVVGTNGKIYVSFNNNGYVHVYENNIDGDADSFWIPVGDNIALAASSENYNSSLAIDSDNNLYLAYVSNTTAGNKLNVKKYDGTSWTQLGSENFTENKVQHVSIAVNTDDKVYVAMSNWSDTNLLKNYVLTYDEATDSWPQAGTGFASVGQATNNSLAIDSAGNLFLAFNDSELGKVSVKKCNMALTPAESITIATANSLPASISTDNGTLQLTSSVTPAAANQNVAWSILTGETLATIDQTGLVTAISTNGIVVVKATSAENASISSTFEITLSNQDSDVLAASVVVTTANNMYPDLLSIGSTLQLSAAIAPIEADQEVIWTVEDGTNVASVDADGLVTSLAEGTATIRATHVDNTEVYDEIQVWAWENGCTQGSKDDNTTFDFGYDITLDSGFRGAADFTVPAGTVFEATQIRMQVDIQGLENSLVNSYNLTFLSNAEGDVPDEEFMTLENLQPIQQIQVPTNGFSDFLYEIVLTLPEPVTFEEGTYWVSPQANTNEGVSVNWQMSTDVSGAPHYRIDPENGEFTWFAVNNFDAIFEITGNCEADLSIDGPQKASFRYFPNPVKDQLTFTTESSIKDITVYNMLGQTLATKLNHNVLDTSALPSGTYLVRAVLENGTTETFKIAKE